MRKLLSLVLVLTLVLGSMSFAFAAPAFSDVDDEDVLAAVKRLNAFGIVDGYDDGSYKPEKSITRAEFAKLLVVALGLGNAAEAAKGSSQFVDVNGDEWFAGYVNVAAGQGILKGYPDGTFGSNNKVKYSEAVTMLVRALGYKDEFLPGSWPGNYVAKAADLDITDDVKFVPDGFANRGAVAVMLDNTLDAKVVKQDTYGDDNNWKEQNETLLEDKLEIVKIEDAAVTAVPKVDSSIDEDQIEINGTAYDVVSEDVLAQLDMLLGNSVNVYLNDDDEVVYVEESDESYKVIYGTIDVGSDAIEKEDDEEDLTIIFPDNDDKDYKFADNYTIYADNEEVTFSEFVNLVKKNDLFAKIVLNDNGNIETMDLNKWDEGGSLIVVDANEDEIKYIINDSDDDDVIKAKDYDKVVIFDVEGNLLSMDDIKKDDIIYLNEKDLNNDDLEEAASQDEVAYILVVRNSMDGEAESYKDDEIKIDGEAYDVAANATVSSNNDQDIYDYDSTDGTDKLDDITGDNAEVTVLFDMKGEVRHVRADIDASSADKYAVVTGTDSAHGDYTVKLLAQDGEEYKYDLDFDAAEFIGYDVETDIKEGDVVKYTLNSDGEVDSMVKVAHVENNTVVVDAGQKEDDFIVAEGKLTDDFMNESVEIADNDYVVDDDVVVFDYTEAYDESDKVDDVSDVEVVDYSKLPDKGENDNIIYVLDDRDAVKLIVLIEDIQSDDEIAGYVVDKWTKDGDPYVEVVLPGEDTVTYEVDENDELVSEENIVIFTENSDGTVDVVSAVYGVTDDFKVYTGIVDDVDGKYVRLVNVDGSKLVTFKDSSDTVYYEEDDVMDFSDVDEGDYIRVAVKDGYAKVVKLYDLDEKNLNDSETKKFLNDYEADNGVKVTFDQNANLVKVSQ
jgi:hypothetical protein